MLQYCSHYNTSHRCLGFLQQLTYSCVILHVHAFMYAFCVCAFVCMCMCLCVHAPYSVLHLTKPNPVHSETSPGLSIKKVGILLEARAEFSIGMNK